MLSRSSFAKRAALFALSLSFLPCDDCSANVLKLVMPSVVLKKKAEEPRPPATQCWISLQRIDSSDAGSSDSLHLAADAAGNTFAVWTQGQPPDTPMRVWSSRYATGSGWEQAEPLDTGAGHDTYSPYVAVNSAGSHAVAVWREANENGDYSLFARLYAAGAWGEVTLVADGVNALTYAKGSIDSAGSIDIVWTDGSTLAAVRHEAGTADWSEPEVIAQHIRWNGIMDPDLGMDANGNTLLVWAQRAVNNYFIAASRHQHEPGAKWAAPESIDFTEPIPISSGSVQLAVNPAGYAVAVWQRQVDICANRYEPSSGWKTPQRIETASGSAGSPAAAVNATGTAVAVWTQSNGTSSHVWASRCAPGTGWSRPELVETSSNSTQHPDVVIKDAGIAAAVWEEQDGGKEFWRISASRQQVDAVWEQEQQLANTDRALFPQAAAAAAENGHVLAAWQKDGGIWAARCE